jgi:hypothetical protein
MLQYKSVVRMITFVNSSASAPTSRWTPTFGHPCLHSVSRAPRRAHVARARRVGGATPLVRKDLTTMSYGCLVGAERRTHRDKTTEGDEEDATPDLLLKPPHATLTAHV